MADQTIRTLTALARVLQRPLAFEELLRTIVDGVAEVLRCERASLRLLDPSRTRLLAVCRAGQPLHENPNVTYTIGEGLVGWVVEFGRPLRTGNAETDPRFVHRPGVRGPLGSFLGVPLISGNTTLGVLSALRPELDAFGEDDEAHLLLLAGICAPHVEIARLNRLARIDPLTGALNRRAFHAAFPEVDAPGGRLLKPLSVIMLDIDDLGAINDKLGRAVGDKLLKSVTSIVGQVLREGDAVVRYEEARLLVIVPDVDLGVAARIAERARGAIERTEHELGDGMLRITASFGVAERDPDEPREVVISRARDALKQAKASGRNQVALAQ